jgi:hypothetical protein
MVAARPCALPVAQYRGLLHDPYVNQVNIKEAAIDARPGNCGGRPGAPHGPFHRIRGMPGPGTRPAPRVPGGRAEFLSRDGRHASCNIRLEGATGGARVHRVAGLAGFITRSMHGRTRSPTIGRRSVLTLRQRDDGWSEAIADSGPPLLNRAHCRGGPDSKGVQRNQIVSDEPSRRPEVQARLWANVNQIKQKENP